MQAAARETEYEVETDCAVNGGFRMVSKLAIRGELAALRRAGTLKASHLVLMCRTFCDNDKATGDMHWLVWISTTGPGPPGVFSNRLSRPRRGRFGSFQDDTTAAGRCDTRVEEPSS